MTSARPYTGRFAPSPTARQHIGNLRTALLVWLDARSRGGRIILRIEDLDPDRSRPEFIQMVLEDYRALGLDWDEGPDRPGPHGPYLQSQRGRAYRDVLEQLRSKGLVYPCFCSRREIGTAAGAPAPGEDGPRYPGTCRLLSPAEADRRITSGASYAWRFRTDAGLSPDGEVTTFTDTVYGFQSQDVEASVGDFVVFRRDGVASYQLAVVTDDHLMGVSCVVRGADLLDSTPRQIAIQKALGFLTPEYIHVPLVVAPGGRKFAKRERDLTLGQLMASGWNVDRIVGFLAYSAGLAASSAPVRAAELLGSYRRDRISRTPTELDPDCFGP